MCRWSRKPGRELVGAGRAARAAVLPVGMEHEVVHDQLRAALEQVEQRHAPVGPLEGVVLGDLDHRQLAPLRVEAVTLLGGLLLLEEQVASGGLPLVLRDDLRKGHAPTTVPALEDHRPGTDGAPRASKAMTQRRTGAGVARRWISVGLAGDGVRGGHRRLGRPGGRVQLRWLPTDCRRRRGRGRGVQRRARRDQDPARCLLQLRRSGAVRVRRRPRLQGRCQGPAIGGHPPRGRQLRPRAERIGSLPGVRHDRAEPRPRGRRGRAVLAPLQRDARACRIRGARFVRVGHAPDGGQLGDREPRRRWPPRRPRGRGRERGRGAGARRRLPGRPPARIASPTPRCPRGRRR